MSEELKENTFKIQKRRLVVVWVYSMKQLNHLKKFGNIHYVSNKMHYVIIYMNEENVESSLEKIRRLHFVRNAEESYRPDVEMNFADKIGTKDALKFNDDGFEVEELKTTIRLSEELG
ncbi:Uncharacterized protein YlbG, UPF0298 family [Pilibacter termitis]|uniref:UPF0298 protein SAMN02745116_01598 n=1 Tax=Pilibacter termitis TaxID=263852 RepID=A0A1T4NYY7_9ENTE|nr:YlbG family protein [Pilibacter termitis]SJZ84620.1 Uncharacterized protein YlbG, UPF0298 family [Pilibacter termitis]